MRSYNRLKNFTIVDNKFIVNSNLSLQAMGLYTFMCSKPDSWRFSYAGLSSQLDESEKTLKKIVKELVLARAIVRHRTTMVTKDGHKYPSYDWIINPDKDDIKVAMEDDPILSLLKNGGDQNGGDQNGGDQNGGDIDNTNPSKKEISKKDRSKESARVVIEHLNNLIGSEYKKNNKFVNTLLKAGYRTEQLTAVVDKKYKDWYGSRNEEWLRPSTLFGDKFEEYLNADSKEERKKREKRINKIIKKIEGTYNLINSKCLNIESLKKLKIENGKLFDDYEMNLLNSYNSLSQLLSLFTQKELKNDLLKKSRYVCE